MTKTEERDALATRKPMNRPASHEEADERQEFLMLDVEFFTKDNEPVLFEHLTPESLRESERLQVINGAIIDVRDREDTANYVRLGQVIDHRLRMWEQAQPIGSRSSGAPPEGTPAPDFKSVRGALKLVKKALREERVWGNGFDKKTKWNTTDVYILNLEAIIGKCEAEADAPPSVSGAPREWRTNPKVLDAHRALMERLAVCGSNHGDPTDVHEKLDALCEAVASSGAPAPTQEKFV